MGPSENLNEAFLAALFSFAEHSVFLTTLPNVRGSRGTRLHERLSAPTADALFANRARVIEKYDIAGQASYFCVSTIDPEKVARTRKNAVDSSGKAPKSERAKETVAEIVCAHVDIDLKHLKIGSGDVLRRLASLRLPPSACIHSGNGIHAYWFLTEALEATADQIAEHEAMLKQIAHAVGGDSQCCEVARLMRTPGSHNSKNGAWKDVEVIAAHTDLDARYEFADLVEFFGEELTPVIAEDEIIKVIDAKTGKERRATVAGAPDNPFEAYIRAEVEAGRVRLPPLDVDRLLASMAPGDSEYGVHNVTLSVTASLVARGWTKDEIIPFVIGAIGSMIAERGLPQGWTPGWMASEERKIVGQIDGAIKKQNPEKLARARERHAKDVRTGAPRLALAGPMEMAQAVGAETAAEQPPFETGTAASSSATSSAVSASNVIDFKIDRKPKAEREKQERKASAAREISTHSQVAGMMLERLALSGRQLCFWRGALWIYNPSEDHAGLWRAYEGKDQNTWIETEIHATIKEANAKIRAMAEEDGHEAGDAFNDDKRLRGEVRAFICTMPELRYDGEWDAHGLTPLANGLFDAETRALSPYAAESRATFRFKAAFDVDAGFANGERMIRDLFEAYGEEADRYVWLIQQFAYVAIFKVGHKIGRQLRRCLYLLGEANSGKSQMLDLLRRVIGEEFSSSTTLDELSDQAQRRFALQSLMDKAIWAADEAASERTKIDAARLKAILAEDIVKTDAKGAKAIERRFLAATVFSSNSFPQTLDKASGFADRFMLVRCPASFDNENPRGVALLAKTAGFNSPADFVAATELSGFLNWALGARDWIEMEKRFDQPAAVVGMREEIADTANPVRAFVKECLEDAPLHISVKSIDIYEAYREWHAEDAGNKHFCLTPKTFWSLVNSYFGGKRGTVPRKIMKRDHATLVAGLKLNEAGEEFWRIASNKRMDGEKSISSTISGSLAGVHGTLDDFHVGVIKSYFVGKTRNDVEPAAAADAPAKDKRPRF